MNPIKRIAVTNMTLPFVWAEAFWTVWLQVMYPKTK